MLLLLTSLSLHNIYTVVKINTKYIPKLKKVFAGLKAGVPVRVVKDSFADLHDYFTISEVTEGDVIVELVVKPIKINTYVVSVKNIVFYLKFNNNRYESYTHEEPQKE